MLKNLVKELQDYNCQLVAVSKTKPIEQIMKLYDKGQRIFGENRVQELCEKQKELPQDIQWHQIGHLQRNKVKYIAPFVSMIHAVDSLRLLEEINKEALKNNRTINCLLQFHIAREESKFGLSLEEAKRLLESEAFSAMNNVRICGVMGMASFVHDEQVVKSEFQELAAIFSSLKENYFANEPSFKERSMGMSGDYPLALEAGSTLVRIGSLLFGNRG